MPDYNGKVFQQDYDALLSSDGGASVFCLSERTWRMIVALTETYHWKTRYFSTSGETIDQDTIDQWASKAERELGMWNGCCNDRPPEGAITRWTITGVLQISFDEGETWTDYPDGDPRNFTPRIAPIGGTDGDAKRCDVANNIFAEVQQAVQQLLTQIATIDSVLGVASAFSTALIPLGVPALPGLVLAVLGGVIAAGGTVIEGALTEEQLDKFFCCLLDNIPADGQITQAAFDAIGTCMQSEMESTAALILGGMLYVLGVNGTNNAGQIAMGGTHDCACAGCEDGCSEETIDITNKITHGWPAGWSLVGDHYAVNDSTWNTLYPAYTGGAPATVEIHFPERCLVRVTIHFDASSGAIAVDAGSAHAEDTAGHAGTYVLEPATPEFLNHISIYGANNTVQVSSIVFVFCDEV